MDPTSQPVPDLENFLRVQLLVNLAMGEARKLFQDMWKGANPAHTDWECSPLQGATFIGSGGIGAALYERSQPIQKKLLATGDINSWDLPLLIQCVKTLSSAMNSQDNHSTSRLVVIRNIRNQASHRGNMEVSDVEFQEIWTSAGEVLRTFGISDESLEAIRSGPITELERSSLQDNPAVREARRIKERGNEAFHSNHYQAAIVQYTSAIQLPGLGSPDLAILYCNRAQAHFKLGNYVQAKTDAKGALLHRPAWWKAYARLGESYKALEKYEKALIQFELGLNLNEGNYQLTECRDDTI
jgi:hypothetical protein